MPELLVENTTSADRLIKLLPIQAHLSILQSMEERLQRFYLYELEDTSGIR